MIAILIASGSNESFEGLQEYLPVPLLHLADRPFLQHVIEYLASQQVRRFELILSHLPEKIEAAMGDGARWGCSFRYHLLPEGADPVRLARTIAAGGSGELIVYGSAECLPEFNGSETLPDTLICQNGEWTGWGVFSTTGLLSPDLSALPRIETPCCLSVRTGPDFLRSQRLALEGGFPGLLISGRQADPGVWLSRNVILHPTAKLTAPVHIGENCRIGRGAHIGPSAVIGNNCIVGEHTIIVDSMVAAGSYVGEGLELDSVIVDRNRLLNIRLGTSLLTSEAFLLGNLTGKGSGRGGARAVSVLAALALLSILWPLLLLTALYLLIRKGAFVNEETVRIPTDDDPAGWHLARVARVRVPGPRSRTADFLFTFLPGLVSVLRGDLFLVGVQPRSRADLLALPPDWRSLYLKTKAGLITEAAITFGNNPSEDELYTAEAFYGATESGRRDCRLFGLWLWQLVSGTRKVNAAEGAN